MALLELEIVIVYGSVDDVEGCIPRFEPTSFVLLEHTSNPYHHPHKNKSVFPMNLKSWEF